ncbi:hypothetical protein M407DRAFT_28402 [Tulasnella calospora MUT 4182]|uniref:Uncharacterized protein n=1 Tax=Tulasnella calospora MUT 4182 TaxID=1051891 RepID=A0A0C3LL08_9AGAM|nr:hypothetical protein M407DRAFT_28402 [Tulasnella calospora MUT 4182]
MEAIQKDPAVEPLLQTDKRSSTPDAMMPDHPNTLGEEGSLKRPFGSTPSPSNPRPHSNPSDDPTADHSDHQLSEIEQKSSISEAQSRRPTLRKVPFRKSTRGDHLEIAQANVSMSHLKPIIKPLLYLIGGCILAIAHHLFNSRANGRPIDPPTKIPQVWVLRIGTGFAFAFKTTLAASLSFVICQLLWFSTRRKYLTVQDINTLYSVERRDIMSTVLSNAVMHGPLLVGATILSFMLPIAAVFTPASLGVRVITYVEEAPCVIAAGNFKNLSSSGSGAPRFSQATSCLSFSDITATVARISETTFAKGAPIPLPEFCGKNCTYKVNVDSMAFKCAQNVPLPAGHMGTFDSAHPGPATKTFWNATVIGDQTEPNSPFYVGWATGEFGLYMDTSVGTNGSAYCVPVSARYEFTVQTVNGAQSVFYNVTTFDQLSPVLPPVDQYGCRTRDVSTADRQIGAIALAARRVLLGSLSVFNTKMEVVWSFNSTVRLASFLNMTMQYLEEQYIWKDVIKGIEETTAHITASLLSLDNGLQNSTCSYGHSKVVYDYNPENLFAPYGVAIFIVAIALGFGVFVFLRFNPDDLTTSFADTISVTRTQEMESFARKHDDRDELESLLRSIEFRLSELPGGYMGYGTKQAF